MAILPSTSDSSNYHLQRVYLQVQEWLRNILNPEECGWIKKENVLLPQTTFNPIAPDFILKMIYCDCKADCTKFYSCKKSGIFCSNLCGKCNGNACSNIPDVEEDSDYE